MTTKILLGASVVFVTLMASLSFIEAYTDSVPF